MRARAVPLRAIIALTPLLIIAATCVHDVNQRGPAGPWTGEVTNYGPDTVGYMYVESRVADATGQDFSYLQAQTCPSVLRPGEKAAFQLTVDPGQLDPRYVVPVPKPPFRLVDDLRVTAQSLEDEQIPYAYTHDGFDAEVARSDEAKGYLLADVTNTSTLATQLTITCAIVRSPTGSVLAVGAGRTAPNQLRPGATDVVPVFFAGGMPRGDIELIVEGLRFQGCCIVDFDHDGVLTVTAAKIVEQPQGRFLWLAGEVSNTSDRDVAAYSLTAHLDDSWTERIDGASLGCDGSLARGDTVPYLMSLPVDSVSTKRQVTIEGIDAAESGPFHRLTVSGVLASPPRVEAGFVSPVRRVSFTTRNDSTDWMVTQPACVGLRDAGGRVVGAGYAGGGDYLAPGASRTVTIDVEQLAASTTVDVIAYGLPQLQPPPTPVQ